MRQFKKEVQQAVSYFGIERNVYTEPGRNKEGNEEMMSLLLRRQSVAIIIFEDYSLFLKMCWLQI